MIKNECFSREWLLKFKSQKNHSRIDIILLEKMIYAFHLLERLRANGLDFVFKGGTSLVLLLKEESRFSIDVDIICSLGKDDLEHVLANVVRTSHFTRVSLDEVRSYKPGVPKAHYKFFYDSDRKIGETILLDVLIENPIYPELMEVPVISKWFETEAEVSVKVPSIDSIAGDKLTAFAPNTIGIPYFKGAFRQSFSMEICKQLFDLGRLFDRIENMEVVADSFTVFAQHEINYRNRGLAEPSLSHQSVLQDTIDTCLIIAKRGTGSDDEKAKFQEIQKGVKSFGAFMMSGNFRLDDAIAAAAKVGYLAAKILVQDRAPIQFFKGQNVHEMNINEPEWNFLNKLKKQPDKSSFFYWYQTVRLLNKAP